MQPIDLCIIVIAIAFLLQLAFGWGVEIENKDKALRYPRRAAIFQCLASIGLLALLLTHDGPGLAVIAACLSFLSGAFVLLVLPVKAKR